MSRDTAESETSGRSLREASTVFVLMVLAGVAGYWAGRSSHAPAQATHVRPSANRGTTDERLQLAAAADNADNVRDLLAQGVTPCRGTATWHMTPLHDAAMNADANLIRRLLDAGADPNGRTINGETPLMELTRSDAAGEESLRALLDGGADINATECKGLTAVDRAEKHGDAALARMLLAHHALPPNHPVAPTGDKDGN
jgi:ankyrin repeat protein